MSRRSPTLEEALLDLRRLLLAIEPYLDEIVLAGGWAPWFHRFHPHLERPHRPALLTFDFDLVVPPVLPQVQSGNLRELLTRGEFVSLTAIDPPVVVWQHASWGAERKAPVFMEVLTPLRGSARDRTGKPKLMKIVQAGLAAQRLRYLDLLLHEPLEVDVGRVEALAIEGSSAVRVPNPSAYILQKALIHDDRRPEARRKDLAYVHDVALTWFGQADAVRRWMASIASYSREWKRWWTVGRDTLFRLFHDAESDGPVSVEAEFRGRPEEREWKATSVLRVVRPFLEAAFADSGWTGCLSRRSAP